MDRFLPCALSTALVAALTIAAPCLGGPIDTLAPGHWYEVPNSTLKALDPCPQRNCSYSAGEGQAAVVDDWNGGAFATGYGTKGGYIVWGGGHGGYYGNEVYVFDIALLQWKRVSEPVANPVCNYTEGELQDGSPCAAHTFDGIDYHPGTNSFAILGVVALEEGITSSPRVHLFNFDTLKWRRGQSYTGLSQGMYTATAYDSSRDVFWMIPAFDQPVGKYDPNANSGAGAWTNYNSYTLDSGHVASIDPTRDILVVIDGYSNHRLIVWDLKSPNSVIVPKVTGDTTPMQGYGNGFDWDPMQKVFVAWTGTSSVYTLTPPSGDWRTGTWVWSKVAAAADNTITPTAKNGNNTYSRWRYAPGVNAWVLVNRTSDNVFFYKLGAGTPAPSPPTALAAH